MEEAFRIGEQVSNGEEQHTDILSEIDNRRKKEFVAPAIGMEFETYEDAYNYYSCYAKEVGFRVRVKNSWFKRNSREKYGAVLCCSSQGFKRIKDVNRLRQETRTGCPAMLRMRIGESKRWRILDVTHEHNHSLGVKIKSTKKLCSGTKRKLQKNSSSEVQKIKLYQALVIDTETNNNTNPYAKEVRNNSYHLNQLNLKKGDTQAMYNYFCRMQLTNPNFLYSMDLNDEGGLRNVFWIDPRSRASCAYFGDIIYIDSTYVSNRYEIPLLAFVGINHHGQSVLLGCGLIAGETTESYTWVLQAWLSCASGKTPQTIITDRCKKLQNAIRNVFPRSHHCFSLSDIMKKVPEKIGGLQNYDTIKKAITKAVYDSLKVIDFEGAWGFITLRFSVGDHEWLRSLYEDRGRWAPAFLKDTCFAGMASARQNEVLTPFFDKYVHKQMSLKEFLDKYKLVLQKKHKEESISDIQSRNSNPILKTRCPFESQLSKLYTREIFHKFQLEVEEMYSCFSTTQLHVDGPIVIFLVKERVMTDRREIRDYEVMYNRAACEVRCICSCFNFYGYLCRHALCVLNFNGVEEIPAKYILARWKKDYKRFYVPDQRSTNNGGNDVAGVQWFNQLYRSALQVVEEGVVSLDHYKAALQAFDESLNRVHDVDEKQEQIA